MFSAPRGLGESHAEHAVEVGGGGERVWGASGTSGAGEASLSCFVRNISGIKQFRTMPVVNYPLQQIQ